MALHYLDPDREPRACPGTWAPHGARCICRGTGRLGVEGAEPDVRISGGTPHWYYAVEGDLLDTWEEVGPYPTESAALEAARKAHLAAQ